MNDFSIHGTTDPDEIAAVLALLRRAGAPVQAGRGISAWREGRRDALATATHRRRPARAG